MKMMKTLMMAAALLMFASAATAEDFPNEPYEFMLAKIAASEARFDDALSLLDKVIQKNPNNAVLPNATVKIENPVTGYTRTTTTGEDGSFRFNDVPQQNYQLTITANGFAPEQQAVSVRTPTICRRGWLFRRST